jgi:4-amino-4-deoxy-L-arabinose transferase-like glycosyltransferase
MFDLLTIITYLKKQFSRRDILYIIGILALFLATRLINLDKFPIFSDEGIYIHWAKTAWHDAAWRFISLTDGKQPLQTWGTIPFLKLFPDNALLGARLFAVTMGMFGLVGMFILLFYLFGKRAALIGSLIFVLNPYFLFYDRLALRHG